MIWVLDQFGHEVNMIPVDEEHFEVNVEVAVSPQFFGWIVGTGGGIRILKPENVREVFSTDFLRSGKW